MRYMRVCVVVSALAIASIAPRAAGQGSIAYWSADDLKSGHAANLPLMTPTRAFNVLRLREADARKAESHEGTTDILFVVSGTGRVTAGGRIEGSLQPPTSNLRPPAR
jgi:mannose-6-phosphate isomerase-like protein (cupin superfamily)